MRILEHGTNRKLFILYLQKNKKKPSNICLKPSEGSKLTKIHHFDRGQEEEEKETIFSH